MNRMLLFLTICGSALFSNCSRHNDPEPATPETQENAIKKLLLGKWQFLFAARDENLNGIADENEKDINDEPVFITFNIDGTAAVVTNVGGTAVDDNIQWMVKDKSLILITPRDTSFETNAHKEIYTITSLNTMEMLCQQQEDLNTVYIMGFVKK